MDGFEQNEATMTALQELHQTLFSTYKSDSLINSKLDFKTMLSIKLNALKAQYSREEEFYVQQKLIENPIKYERRRSTPYTITEKDDFEKIKKSESCRKSRYNNKLKMAVTKYKCEFVTKQLEKSLNNLKEIYQIIQHAENRLIQENYGWNESTIMNLRSEFGITQHNIEYLRMSPKEINDSSDDNDDDDNDDDDNEKNDLESKLNNNI